MSSIWKTKVMPKFKKFFDKGKKKGASEVCKNFDKSKESLDKEIEEKGTDLNPKVVEIYRSSSTFVVKKLLKEPNEANVKGNPEAVQGVLQEFVKAGFPGAQVICDAGTKFGPGLLPGPIVYLFQKASVYLVEESLPEEPKGETREMSVEDIKAEAPAADSKETTTAPDAEAAAAEEDKKEEAVKESEESKVADAPPAVVEAAAATETPVSAVVETLAESGVTVPAVDTTASAAPEPAPAPASPPPAADKTE